MKKHCHGEPLAVPRVLVVQFYSLRSKLKELESALRAGTGIAAGGGEFAHGRWCSWARLTKKVYEADPLVCPRCFGPLTIISLIGNAPVIEKILRHLKLRPARAPAAAPCLAIDPL